MSQISTGSAGGGTWGSITGTLSSQTDLQTELDGKVSDTGAESVAGVKTFSDGVVIGGGVSASTVKFLEPSGSGTNYTTFAAQAQAGNIDYILPPAIVTNGYLKTDSGGSLTWATVSPSYPLLADAGSASAPSYAFSGGSGYGNKGMYSGGSNILNIANVGLDKIIMDATGGLAFYSTQSAATTSFIFNANDATSGSNTACMTISRGTWTGSMPGLVWVTGTAPSASGQAIGFRMGITGGTMAGDCWGTYSVAEATNSNNAIYSQYNANGGNVGVYALAQPSHNSACGIGVVGFARDGKLNAGGVFGGFDPRDVSGNQAYGVRAYGFRLSGAMSNPSQVVGVYGYLMSTDSTANEQRDPGVSAAGVFDNGDLAVDILNLRDNTTEVFAVEDGGTVDMSGIAAGTPNFRFTATSDTPTVAFTGGGNAPTTAPAGYVEVSVGGNARYIPFWA